jgi:hypothetical protein
MTTFIGLEIEGDIQHTQSDVEQYPPEQLAEAFQNALAQPRIRAICWLQYTPYFNDGDTCVFGVHTVSFAFTDIAEPDEYGEPDESADDYEEDADAQAPGFYTPWSDTYRRIAGHATREYKGGGVWETTALEPGEGGQALLEAVVALESAIEGGHHDVELHKLFGDHAEVTVTRQGITVEFWEHD